MVKVYSKADCVQCRFTQQWLMDNDIVFEEVDVETQVGAIDEVRALGYASLPVVVNGVEHWYGFNPDKLEELLCLEN